MVALPSRGRRAAAIDIGTNSILLTVAEWQDGGLKVLVDRATVTRLGEGVDQSRRLAPAAISRSLECLRDYAQVINAYGVDHLAIVGTSALRDTTTADGFLRQAERVLGCRPHIIDGEEEARLTCVGAFSGLQLNGPFVVVDVGGGSTELIVGNRDGMRSKLSAFASLDIGCVKFTERFFSTDPPKQPELERATNATVVALQSLTFDISQGTMVGLAGTVTTLCAMHLGLPTYDPTIIHGTRLEIGVITELRRKLSSLNREQRCRIPGLHPNRADVIVTGAIIVEQLLRLTGHSDLVVSDHGVRYGLLYDLFYRTEPTT